MRNDSKNLIVEESFKFALEIINFCNEIENAKKYSLAKQLFKSGTSIGANVKEAQNAESKADFIHKMKISAKEADETEYWLLLCKNSMDYPFSDKLLSKCQELIKIISKIISTSKKSYN